MCLSIFTGPLEFMTIHSLNQLTADPGYNYCQQYCCLLCSLSLLIILSIVIIIKLSIDRVRYNRLHLQVAVNYSTVKRAE